MPRPPRPLLLPDPLRRLVERRPGRTVAAAVFLVVVVAGQLAIGMRASRTASITADEPFYLLTTQSLVSDGDLDLRDEYRNGEEARFWDGTIPLWKQMEPAPDGRLLSPHDPGLSLLAVPGYVVGGLRGVQRSLVLPWALAAALAAAAAIRLRAPPWAAVLAGVAVGAGAPGVVYASQIYPEGPAALAVAVILFVVTGDRARPVVVAAAAVALAWLGTKYVPLGALLGGAWAWRFRTDRRAVVLAGATVAAFAVHHVWWHLRTFGGLTPYGTNVVWAGEGTTAILADHLDWGGRTYRLYGLYLDERFGLFRWSPAAIVGLWGLGRRTWLPAALMGVATLVATFGSITMMGWWFPGRLLVAALPGLVVLVAVGGARIPRTAVALTAWTLAIAVAVVVATRWGRLRLAVDPFDLGFPSPPGHLLPDFRSFGVHQVVVSLGWAVGVGVALSWPRLRQAIVGRRRVAVTEMTVTGNP